MIRMTMTHKMALTKLQLRLVRGAFVTLVLATSCYLGGFKTRKHCSEHALGPGVGGAVEQLVAMRESGALQQVSLGMNSNVSTASIDPAVDAMSCLFVCKASFVVSVAEFSLTIVVGRGTPRSSI